MARKQFLLKYPDRSKTHITCAERDDLLLRGLITSNGPNEYAYIGQSKTYHSFAELEQLKTSLVFEDAPKRKFLSGSFIIEFSDKRFHERLETPEHMAYRLKLA